MLLRPKGRSFRAEYLMRPRTVELTSKPVKLWLALSGTAFLISFIGMVVSFGETDMSTKSWFISTVITFCVYRLCRAARWWANG